MAKAKTELDVLRGAYGVIDRPEKWQKHDYVSAGRNGEPCFCLDGALQFAAGRHLLSDNSGFVGDYASPDAYWAAYRRLDRMSDGGLIYFNDLPNTTFRDVRAVLRKAIKAAEKDAA